MDSKLILSKRRDIFFKNLLLLGLETSLMKKKHSIDFHKDMFSVPNKKGFEIITYFLFMKLNKMSDEDYSIVWPLLDKDHERQFKKTCFNHILNISQKSTIRFPRIVQSIFTSPGGDRFYTLYLAFSTYVLEQQVKKNGNVHLIERSSAHHNNFKDILETLKISTITATTNFQDTQMISLEHQQKLVTCAKDFYSQYRNIKKCLTSKDMLLREKKILLSSLHSEFEGVTMKDNLEAIDAKIVERCKKVKEFWILMEDYHNKEKELWEIIRCALEDNGSSYSLDGCKYMCSVPDILLKNCSEELQKDILKKQENGSELCLFSFIKLMTSCLDYFVKRCKKAGVIESHLLLLKEKDISTGDETLQFIKSLSKKLSDVVIPDMEKQNTVFKQELLSDQFLEPSPILYSDFPPLSPKINYDAESIQSRCVLPCTGRVILFPSSESSINIHLTSMVNETESLGSDLELMEINKELESENDQEMNGMENEIEINQSTSEDSWFLENDPVKSLEKEPKYNQSESTAFELLDPEESFENVPDLNQSESGDSNELEEIDPEESFIVQPNFSDGITPLSYPCRNSNIEYASRLETINESTEETSVQCVPIQKELPSFLEDYTFDDAFYSLPSTSNKKHLCKNNRRTKFKFRDSWYKEDVLTSITASDLVDFSPT